MKKLIIAFVMIVSCSLAFAQDEIGYYTCSYFEKEYLVAYSDGDYFIQFKGEYDNDNKPIFFMINKSKIEKFRKALSDTKAKYVEWTNVAKEHNVEKFDKKFDVSFPSGNVAWKGADYWFTLGVYPEPRFLITNGKYLCLLFSGKKFKATSNQYVDTQGYWVFSSPEEIDELIELLSPEALYKTNTDKQKTEDLFH